MPSVEEHIRKLCQWPHRGTTTGNEARAADYVKEQLQSLGYTVHEESFTAPDGALYRTFIFIIICEIAATIISRSGSGAAVILAAFPFFYLFAKFYLLWPIDNLIFPTGKSRNVIGKLENPGAKKRVILTAHLDSQLGSFLFEPGWLGYHKVFTAITAICSLLSLLFAVVRVAGGTGRWMATFQFINAAAMLPLLYLFLRAEYTGQFTQGASDDASGVGAILGAAERLKENPPKNIEVWIVATGAEETGLCGMSYFLRRGVGKNLDKSSTFFINHDNLGGGSLRYLTAEVLPAIKYRGAAVGAAAEAARSPDYPKASPGFWDVPTDALAPTAKGYSAVTIFAYDDLGRTPHYHHITDTVDNLDFTLTEDASKFALGIIKFLDT